jgi:hypothetical protein
VERPENRRHRPPGVVASRRVAGDAELNPPNEPEYVLLDKYIYTKEAAHIRAR